MKLQYVSMILVALLTFGGCTKPTPAPLTAPTLNNNPSWDVIVTSPHPIFSLFNAKGGEGKRTYTIQIDTVDGFDSQDLIEYSGVPEKNEYITEKRHSPDKAGLVDKTRYYWRALAVDRDGNKGPWATSRFYVDTTADDAFMNLVRIPVQGIEVSSGFNAKNIIDLDDPGQLSFWQSTPPGAKTQWVEFDLGRTWEVARIWMLSSPQGPDGWPTDFVWQMSHDGRTWVDINGTQVKSNDTFRNILDFDSVSTRFVRLLIKKWQGYAVQINAITLYSPGRPPVPEVPEGNYVLLVGNQKNGFTFTELANFVEGLGLGLKTLTVPHYEVSLEMINKLKRKPVAIILSGNNANYQTLPMFEYNGEYEIILQSNIPILGICCGHQQLAMAYGYTFARAMGWHDITAMARPKVRTKIEVVKDDPIFDGMIEPFTAAEIHGWEVAHTAGVYEVIAKSDYIQAMRSKERTIYGEQFHAEIKVPYNQGAPYLVNFLKMAMGQRPK